MTQADNVESGFKSRRVEFIREDSPGEWPEDPEWELFSDNLETALVWSGDAQIEEQRGVGDADPNAHFAGPEDHTASIEYHLQRFFDEDPAGDALLRNAQNDVEYSHMVVDKANHGAFRTYTVARGAFPDIGGVEGDPGSGLPILVTLDYEVKKTRSYRVYQPTGETALEVVSTSDADTGIDVTIQNDGGTVVDTITLDGTTPVAGTEQFDSIDAFELSEDAEGDVTVREEDVDGEEFVTIYGAESYDGIEGDRGVPVIGDGSRADEVGEDYEVFLNDEISSNGEPLAVEIRSADFSVDNGYDKAPVVGTKQQAIHPGERDIELSATIAGNYESHESMSEHLRNVSADVTWHFDGGSVTFEDAALVDTGDVGPSAGDAVSTVDNSFSPTGISVDPN